MFKKLLLCAGVVASLHASADLDITFENHTDKVFMIQNVRDNYSRLLNSEIGEGVEIEPKSVLNFKISVVPTLYFMHTNQMTSPDEIELDVIDIIKQNTLEKFSISWERDSAHVEFKKTFPYKISQKTDGNAQFIFTLESK